MRTEKRKPQHPKPPKGRPAERIIEPIPDTFENVLKVVVATRPKPAGR